MAAPEAYLDKDNLRSLLIRGASGSFVLKVVAAGLAFITSIILARLLGVEGYGTYSYALAWVALLLLPATLGADKLIVRNVSAYRATGEWGLIRGLLLRSNQAVLVTSLTLVLLAFAVTRTLFGDSESELVTAFIVALPILPLTALTCLRQAVMQGLHRVVTGQLPEMLVRPVLFLAMIAGVYFFLNHTPTAVEAVGMSVLAVTVAFLVGTQLLRVSLPRKMKEAALAYDSYGWLKSVVPLIMLGSIQIVNSRVDIIMLGALKGAGLVGIYAICLRGAELILFVLVAINTVIAPEIARLYALGEIKRLQRMITKSARVILIFSLPVSLAMIFFGYWFLLMFGQDFILGQKALAILSVGQLISTTAGSVGLILLMTGHERDLLWSGMITVTLNLTLNAILIPHFSISGAAIATAISNSLWPVLACILVYKRIGINSTVFRMPLFLRS